MLPIMPTLHVINLAQNSADSSYVIWMFSFLTRDGLLSGFHQIRQTALAAHPSGSLPQTEQTLVLQRLKPVG